VAELDHGRTSELNHGIVRVLAFNLNRADGSAW
jgi:hypothetical protein